MRTQNSKLKTDRSSGHSLFQTVKTREEEWLTIFGRVYLSTIHNVCSAFFPVQISQSHPIQFNPIGHCCPTPIAYTHLLYVVYPFPILQSTTRITKQSKTWNLNNCITFWVFHVCIFCIVHCALCIVDK